MPKGVNHPTIILDVCMFRTIYSFKLGTYVQVVRFHALHILCKTHEDNHHKTGFILSADGKQTCH